jgi:hypothetical protein
MRDAISHTIFEARLKIDIKASFARGCRGKSSRSHGVRSRFALISTPRPIRAQRRGLLSIECPIYHLRIDLMRQFPIPLAIPFHLTKRSQEP